MDETKTIWRKKIEEGNFTQEEINAIANRVIEMKKTEKAKKRPVKEIDDLTAFNYEDLEALSISDSDSGDDSSDNKNNN